MPNQNDKAELLTLFGKPPESVIKYFRDKKNKAIYNKKSDIQKKGFHKSHWDWSDTLRHAHDRVFVVAKATSIDIVNDIKKDLTKAIAEGKPYQSFANDIIPKLKEHGWWGKGDQINQETGEVANININQRRLRNIYQTNVRTAYAAGHYEEMKNASDVAPYWRYIAVPQGPRNKNPRADHQMLHNLVFKHDDPFWDTHYPPNGWGCHCRVEALSKKSVEKMFGKSADDVVKKTKPEDYVKETIKVQGKSINVNGYKIGGRISLPSIGWDYAPGSYSYQYQKLLEKKLWELPNSTAKMMMVQLEDSIKKSFKDMVQMDSSLNAIDSTKSKSFVSIGILPDFIKRFLVSNHFKIDSSIMTFEQKRIHHTLRDVHVPISVQTLENVPDLIKKYIPTYRKDNIKKGIVFFSEPFEVNGVKKRNKLAFNYNPTTKTMSYATGEIVEESDIIHHEVIKK